MPEEQTDQPALVTIIFSPMTQVAQVEDFPEGAARSVKGALHVKPSATRVVTQDEAQHLKARGINFTVIGGKLSKPTPPIDGQPAPPGGPLFQGQDE